jgi:hypothetical protein
MIVIFGGYGTFGAHAARALVAAGLPVRIAGRDATRAVSFAATLGPEHEGIAADADDPASCVRALAGTRVAVSCAGPFSKLRSALPAACLETGVHYVDIADDRAWTARLRARDGEFRERGLTAAVGCSSLPGISGALAVLAAARLPKVRRARITLFIGNRNPKGDAAVRSAAAQLGRRFSVPQGSLRGFHGREIVLLPPPFGPRGVYDWESPELDLFPALIGVRELWVKVGFESRFATGALAALAQLGLGLGGRLALGMAPLARLLSGSGHSGGCVKVELFGLGGTCSASLGGASDGQRMAALPAAYVAQGLLDGNITARGVVTAYEAIRARSLVERLVAAGYELRET